MKTVILYGELAKRFGKTHSFAVRNAREAIRALKANFPGFASYMGSAHQAGVGFKIFVGGSSLDYSDLNRPAGGDIIRIAPVIMGAGGGWFKILIGAVLIAAGVVLDIFGGEAVGIPMIGAGIGLIFGGVAQLLTSPPKTPQGGSSANLTSYLFNGPANTTAQGSAIPVLYGRLIVGSCIVSAGIESYGI